MSHRADRTYEDMRTGPHHVFGIIGGKSGLYGYMLLQIGKEIIKTLIKGNQVQLTLTYVTIPFLGPPLHAPENNNYLQTKYAIIICM